MWRRLRVAKLSSELKVITARSSLLGIPGRFSKRQINHKFLQRSQVIYARIIGIHALN
jgi:hypothetical protein